MTIRKLLGTAVLAMLFSLSVQAFAQPVEEEEEPIQTKPSPVEQLIDKELLGTPAAPQGQFDLRLALPEEVRMFKGGAWRYLEGPLGEMLPGTALPAVQMPTPGQAAPRLPAVQQVPSMVAPAPAPAAPAAPRPQQKAPEPTGQTLR
ncbi:MAG: hypothetical protein ACE5JZ_05430 [Kiloniellales bacterium]